MKSTPLFLICIIINLTGFSQPEWTKLHEHKSQFIEDLSSGGMNYQVFAAGRVTSSAYAQHVLYIDEWRISRDHISTNHAPHGVFSLDENNVWVCGDKGMISRSRIRGNEGTWVVQETPTEESLQSIWFSDTLNGWAVGKNATILFTINGGNSWQKYQSPLNMNFIKVIFTAVNNGYILADKIGSAYKGKILKTTDGGSTWRICEFDCTIQDYLTSMYFFDTQNGWICGKGGFITHTTNGGLTWKTQQRYLDGLKSLNDIHFRTINEGWACGLRGLLYHTTDGGNTWTQQDIGEKSHFLAIEFNGPYLGWLSTAGQTYMYKDERFQKYRNEYLKNGPPETTKLSNHPAHNNSKTKNTVENPKFNPTPVIVGEANVAFSTVEKDSKWEIRSYQNSVSQLNKALNQIKSEGYMPVGLSLVNNRMEVFVINSQPFICTNWTLKEYKNTNELSAGISKMIESGYLPTGMTLVENSFNVIFAKTKYTGHGWQIVESDLDHQDVANDIQPHLENGYIPVGISVFAGYYYTLLIQPDDFPVNNYSIRGYDESQSAHLKNGINMEISNGMIPQGYFKQEGIINILYLKY